MADAQIVAGGVSAAPLAYTVPGQQEIILKALFATFDGTAAATFLPCIRILAPGGKVVGEYITDSAVAAGGSAEVSFAPFLKAASTAAPTSSALSWCLALSDTVSVTSGAGSSSLFDFTGGLVTNDATTFTLVTQASGKKTPSLNSAGIYIIAMLAQGSIGGAVPAAGSTLKISQSSYGNEPIGNATVGIFYQDTVTTFGQVNAKWFWVLDLGGGGSQPPFSSEIGVRQNSGTACNTSVNFWALRVDTAGDSIV